MRAGSRGLRLEGIQLAFSPDGFRIQNEAPGFVIITRSQKAYSDAEGIMPPGSIDEIEQALLESPRFRIVRESADARVFALDPVLGRMGDWVR